MIFIHLIIISNFLIINSFAVAESFEPEFGWAPKIDGDIDKSEDEWENASKEEIFLISESPSNEGLPVDIWVLQNESNLFISIQFELEDSARSPEEFVGIVISESDSENDFYDVKLVQFSNLGGPSEEFEYLDLYISNDQYIEDKDRKNPLVSPLFADLQGLPPLLIHVGSSEILLDDSVRFAKRAKEAGVDVTLEIWEDMIHVFHAFAEWSPESQQAIEKVAEFIQKHIKKEHLVAD